MFDWAQAEVKASTISIPPAPTPASEPAAGAPPPAKRPEDWLAKPVENAARFQSTVKEAKEGTGAAKGAEDEEAAKKALVAALMAQDKRAGETEPVVASKTEAKAKVEAGAEASSSSSPTADYLQNLSVELAEANLDTEKVLEEVTQAMGQLKETKMMTEVVPQVSRGATTPRTPPRRRCRRRRRRRRVSAVQCRDQKALPKT